MRRHRQADHPHRSREVVEVRVTDRQKLRIHLCCPVQDRATRRADRSGGVKTELPQRNKEERS